MNIHRFKSKDMITRIVPTKFGEVDDYSYVGRQLIFIGIANAMIYLKEVNGIFTNHFVSIRLENNQEGWDYWIDPELLLEDDYESKLSEEHLNEKIRQAVLMEDYKEAERLKKILSDKHREI